LRPTQHRHIHFPVRASQFMGNGASPSWRLYLKSYYGPLNRLSLHYAAILANRLPKL
jgi:hypothetical protein